MNRVEVVTGSCIALLAAVSVGQLYLDKPVKKQEPKPAPTASAPIQPETKPIAVEEVIGTFMTGLTEGSEVGRLVTLGALLEELNSPEYAKAVIPAELAEPLAKAAIGAMGEIGTDSKESWEVKKQLARFLAGRTKAAQSKEFSLKVLEEGPDDMRQAVLGELGAPHGIGGRDVFAKVSELGAKGVIGGERLPGLLRRTGGKKGIEPIMAVMKSTDNGKVISACAIALQDYQDPALMGPVLERLEQLGMLENPKKTPWIGGKILAKHLETAEGSALSRGIKIMKTRPSLVKSGAESLKRAMEIGDAETKRTAAELAGTPIPEAAPVLKAELKSPEAKQQ